MTITADNRNLIATCPSRCPESGKYEFGHHGLFTAQDWQMFFAIQNAPPEPTERMKKALQTYNKIIDNQP